ncbi:hypothetical protein AYI69_g8823 [Smittium culicis]|uniref:Uncharacterized protein n=1 Tax=Smittium culicis TaxID=133412 RepID=A0A1R1XGU9_9FUNG|nr:hypothetical protein AYI69_g8823 [Smittium culicis]
MPPTGSISHIKPFHHPIIDGVSKHDTLNDVNKQNVDIINKNEVNFDENLNFSSSEVPSSPINIKKEMLSPKSCVNESSGGFNTPLAHDIMAEKARMGQISTQKNIVYASNIDGARPGSNLAVMDLDTDPPDQNSSYLDL